MEEKQYVCPKCEYNYFEEDIFQAVGGNFSKLFDIQDKKFTTISCKRCGYTEIYKKNGSKKWDILDALLG